MVFCTRRGLSSLQAKIEETASVYKAKLMIMKKEHAATKIGDVKVQNVLGGMRGIQGMLTQTSALDPHEGITFRGFTIEDIELTFPKKDHQPLPEGILHLLLTGEKPTEEDVNNLSRDLYDRGQRVSEKALDMIRSLPKETHPMTALSIGLMACQTQSHFFKAYQDGVNKSDYWLATYEDAMDLIAKIPVLAGLVYQWKYRDGTLPSMDPQLDWAANYARLMGYDNDLFDELMRLYMFLHCDHEGGNVSAHTTHLVGSALSDPYISYAAGVNGLAGPLHGSANSECLKFLKQIQEKYGELPTPSEVAQFVKDTLGSGRVVPGYGHAVLKHTDPRFTSQKRFADAFLPDDPICRLVDICYEEIPPILQATGKVSNPWPNVDSHSGALLQYFGLDQYDYFTVLFAVSRSLGCMSNLVLDRYFGLPIERPKSLTYEQLEKLVKASER